MLVELRGGPKGLVGTAAAKSCVRAHERHVARQRRLDGAGDAVTRPEHEVVIVQELLRHAKLVASLLEHAARRDLLGPRDGAWPVDEAHLTPNIHAAPRCG